ncbi:MAG: hypothetical protein A3I66_13935 [Burkholderiales bacterium RIFCSPLOWO2_02_FULL_57_36]|nr:MAG: hypothetical protein A3I66_13935 [Burkholderiales bacterium RIFCSPLOWO2_02_FULL_57_36]
MPAYVFGLQLQCPRRRPQAEQAGKVKDHTKEETCVVAAAARDQMEMHVWNVLVGSLAVIEQKVRAADSESGAPLRRDYMVADFKQMALYGLVELVEFLRVPLRNDKHVAAAQRMNIHEGDAEFVFVDMGRRFASRGDLAEQAEGGIYAHVCFL